MLKMHAPINIAILTVFLFSCGPLYITTYKNSEKPVQKYEYVEIPDFRKTEGEWVPYDSNVNIPDLIAKKLIEQGIFKIVDRSGKALDADSNVLLVKGVVTRFDRGCKFCEWIFFGIDDSGLGSMSVWVQLIDKKSGTLITDFSIRARAKKPGYGNSRYTRVVDKTVEIINQKNN
ncbi:MAG: hypothetical protein ACRENO_09470 [Thermodesulfobacteriota bacterium]